MRCRCITNLFRAWANIDRYLAVSLMLFVLGGDVAAQMSEATALVSVNAAGTASGNRDSDLFTNVPRSAISADGRFVLFGSKATDLVPGIGDHMGLIVRDTVMGTTRLVSVNRAGTSTANGPFLDPCISADGRFVAFASFSDDLVANDNNRTWDVFVRDLVAGTITLVSVNLTGTSSTAYGVLLSGSNQPRISADGRFILFASDARDLVPNDHNDSTDLFMRDLVAGTTTLVSVNRASVASGNRTRLTSGGFFNSDPLISADGRYAAFVSYASNLTADDTVCYDGPCDGSNSLNDVFVRDLVAGTTTLVSVNRAGTAGGNFGSSDPSLSADGRRVAFRSLSTDLVTNDTTPQSDIYVRDLEARTTTLVSVNRFGTNGGSTPTGGVNSFDPMICANGRFVAFVSSATDLVANKTDFLTQDVFVRDLARGTTTLVSVNRAGRDSPSPRGGPISSFSQSRISDISADGRFIAFESNASDLVANDTNGAEDVFVRDVAANTTTLASVNRAGTASGNGESIIADLSPDGHFVAFQSNASDLVANDTNGVGDVFLHSIPQPGPLQFSAADYSVSEGAGSATITVTRTGDIAGAASVNYSTVDDPAPVRCDTANGTAYARCDYATAADTLRFAPGEAQKTFTIPLVDDAHVEGDETVRLRLSDLTGALPGALGMATLTITDNDAVGAANPILASPFFVRQHYLDFLSREPEPEGYQAWLRVLNNCPDVNNNPSCDRISVSSSFFRSQEFQLKGYFVFLFYKVALDRLPQYDEIVRDLSSVTGQTTEEVYDRKAQFASAFTGRPEFISKFDAFSNAQYVDALLNAYGVTQIMTVDPSSPDTGGQVTLTRDELVSRLTAGGAQALTRAQVLRAVVQSREVDQQEYNGAFVAMQYYGYLRRMPEEAGYSAWLNYLNAHPSDYRTMVGGFVNSIEYRLRFGQP